MKNSSNKIIIIMFIVFLLSVNILNIVIPDKEFSELENRVLSQIPKFQLNKLLSGQFTNKFEEYYVDQFSYREFWVGFKAKVEKLLNKTENNGIYFGGNGYLFEEYKNPGTKIKDNTEIINEFSGKYPDIATYFLLVPNSIKIYEEKLPLFASPYDQLDSIKVMKDKLNKSVEFIDVYETLMKNKDEYIYFKTDHHWTMRGAYYGYTALAKELGLNYYKMDSFNSRIVSKNFLGTYYSKAQDWSISPDSIEVFYPKFDIQYEVSYKDTNKSTNSLYESSHLEEKDKYSYFLDGNHALITINTSIKNGKKIAIFKDSYSHSFIPFLVNHYEEIHVIDLRYYNLSINDYLEKNNIKEVLFLYNVSTFSKDNNIRKINY
ncbi:MAG: hypothetical protein FH761_07845 [Firmicutes bacterium]|nr:hypothetical protein [Bacillota bacterium]